MGGHMRDIVASSSFFEISEEEEVLAINPFDAGDGLRPDFLAEARLDH